MADWFYVVGLSQNEEIARRDPPLSACTSRFVDGSNSREKEERCSNA
jgi:hypothetical protein